jgi:hypothetical protein
MSGAYRYVDGADLQRLILEIRTEFLARLPYGSDDMQRPNSVRLVAIDIFEGKTADQQLSVLRDLLEVNPGLTIAREDDRDIFEYSDTPAAYLTDLVCEVVCQVLDRDPTIRDEDDRRMARSAESADERE